MSLCNEHIGAAEVSATWVGLKTVHSNVQHVHDDLAIVDADLASHDADIKARLGEVQGTVDENQRLIKVSMARQAEIRRLLITPSGRREINPDVLSCAGADCPQLNEILSCKNGLDWPCK